MKEIYSTIAFDTSLLDRWYQLDTNAIPAEYVLQPRGKEFGDYKVWEVVEKKLLSVLREAVSQLSFSEEQRIKYLTSATHQEIMSGALNPVDVKEKPEDHVFALIRETEGLPVDNTAEGFIDLINDRSDPYSKDQLIQLKGKLKEKLGNQYIPYKAKWKEKKTEMNDPDGFENTIYNFLENIIKEQLKDVISPDEISHEVKLHSEFKDNLTEHFCGRDDILKTLNSYLNNSTETTLKMH